MSTGKRAYLIFTKGIRKLAFRPPESNYVNRKGWTVRIERLTELEADNINDADIYWECKSTNAISILRIL